MSKEAIAALLMVRRALLMAAKGEGVANRARAFEEAADIVVDIIERELKVEG